MNKLADVDDGTQLEVAPGVAFFMESDSGGFVETPAEIYRVQGKGFGKFVHDVLPKLSSGLNVGLLRAHLDAIQGGRETADALAAFVQRGFVLQRSAGKQQEELRVAVVGRATLLEVLPRPELLGTNVTVLDAADLEAWLGQAEAERPLVVVLSDRSQDPLYFAVNAQCLKAGVAVLFAGLERGGAAWVAPIWQPGKGSPCFECFVTRVNLNHDQGKLRHEYQKFMRQTGQTPAAIPCEPHLGLRVFERVASAVSALRGGQPRSPSAGFEVEWLQRDQADVARSRVYPVPHCPACWERQLAEAASIEVTGRMDDAVDKRTGILHADFKIDMAPTDPSVYSHGCHFRDLTLLSSHLTAKSHGGAGTTPETARASAIGESLERYAASLYDNRGLVFASHDELREPAVHPESLELFAEHQYQQADFPFQPFRSDTKVRWAQAQHCDGGAPVRVPAALVYMPYRRMRGEVPIFPSVTSGLAAGPSLEAAVLAGLCEIVERDAVSASWFCKIAPRRWNAELVEHQRSLRGIYPEDGTTTYRTYDISLDLPLSVALVVAEIKTPRGDQTQIGSACRVRPAAAIDKATLEAAQSFPYVRNLLDVYRDWDPGPDFHGVDSFQKHGLLYSKFPQLRQQVGYLLTPDFAPEASLREENPLPVAPAGASSAEDLARTVAGLCSQGYSPLFVDLTTPDLRHIGVHVVRVLVPGLLQLAGNHRIPVLGRRRLGQIRERLGLPEAPLNLMPHPLP
jgi:ribosomal protein S12 methylthiotransferase accessory factor